VAHSQNLAEEIETLSRTDKREIRLSIGFAADDVHAASLTVGRIVPYRVLVLQASFRAHPNIGRS
jgi:hypothetical protein